MESHEKRLAATPFVSAVSLFSMSDGQCLMAEFLHLTSDILHQKGPSDEEPVPSVTSFCNVNLENWKIVCIFAPRN